MQFSVTYRILILCFFDNFGIEDTVYVLCGSLTENNNDSIVCVSIRRERERERVIAVDFLIHFGLLERLW